MSESPPLSSAELKRAKRNVRRTTLAARDAIDAAVRSDRGSAITGAFMRLPEVEAARVVMVFWSFGSEVPTGPLIDALHARGIVVALPHIVAGEMQPRRYEPGDPLTETAFGAMEPSAGVLDRTGHDRRGGDAGGRLRPVGCSRWLRRRLLRPVLPKDRERVPPRRRRVRGAGPPARRSAPRGKLRSEG